MDSIKNILKLVTTTSIYFVATGIVLISVMAKDEGTLGDNLFLNFAADYLVFFAISAMSFASLFAKTSLNNIEYLSLLILLSSLIYTIVTYKLLKFVREYRYKKFNSQKQPQLRNEK